jgi:hypothetical protein
MPRKPSASPGIIEQVVERPVPACTSNWHHRVVTDVAPSFRLADAFEHESDRRGAKLNGIGRQALVLGVD